jgi:hypothetical protein
VRRERGVESRRPPEDLGTETRTRAERTSKDASVPRRTGPGVRDTGRDVERVREGPALVDGDDVDARRHDLGDARLLQVEDALDHAALSRAEAARPLGAGDEQPELRLAHVVDAVGLEAAEPQHALRPGCDATVKSTWVSATLRASLSAPSSSHRLKLSQSHSFCARESPREFLKTRRRPSKAR